jgi:hypothetical protein
LSKDERRVLAALDRRIAQTEAAAHIPQVEARASLEALRAQIVGYVRPDALLKVPLSINSIYTLVEWSEIFIRRGVVIPASWPEKMLEWLTSENERHWLQRDDHARLLTGCLVALMFSDKSELAAAHIRRLCAESQPYRIAADLLVPIAVSGISDQISPLAELMPGSAQEQYWWAWREAFRYLSLARRLQLVEELLSRGLPEALREVILERRQPDLSAMLAETVEASESLRAQIEALATSEDARMRQFALILLSNIGTRQASIESLLALAVSQPDLRDRIGHMSIDTRWQPPEGGRWRGIAVPHATSFVRKKLLHMTVEPDAALRHWAVKVLYEIDASVDGEFPVDEPRHPDLASNIRWPFVR